MLETTQKSRLELPEGKITQEALEELRAMVGIELRPERYIREATIDTITNYVNGIGDLNPLYRDESYAKWTRYGSIVAPPSFVYARTWPGRSRFGLPGVHGFHAGNEFHFDRVIRLGDRIDCVDRLVKVEEKESRFSQKLVITTVETTFTNQHGERIGRVLGWTTRHERAAARETGKYKDVPAAHTYTASELTRIEQLVANEPDTIRGATPRYWEDVNVGEELPVMVRGPLSITDLTAFLVGTGRGRAHGAALLEARKHPGHYFRNPNAGGALEYTGMGHQLDYVAREVGVPGTYDFGPQRVAWLTTFVTNWMGDSGFLKAARGELRRFNVLGDTTFFTGRVTEKRIEGNEPLVRIEIAGENQRGEATMPGWAMVRLPSKRV